MCLGVVFANIYRYCVCITFKCPHNVRNSPQYFIRRRLGMDPVEVIGSEEEQPVKKWNRWKREMGGGKTVSSS